jgi:GNAT superfamily N-acetyltransferase
MIEIRKIQKGEEAAAKKLITSIMEGEFPQVSKNYPVDDLNSIRDHYGALGEAFFVAAELGNVVGTVAVKRDDERTALLRRIFVSPACRNQRIGTRLIERAIEFCSEVGYQEIVFKATAEMKGANKLCLENGFQEKARVPLGPTFLIKYALFLKQNSPLADSSV